MGSYTPLCSLYFSIIQYLCEGGGRSLGTAGARDDPNGAGEILSSLTPQDDFAKSLYLVDEDFGFFAADGELFDWLPFGQRKAAGNDFGADARLFFDFG